MRMGNFLKELGLDRAIYTNVPDKIDCTYPDYAKVEMELKEKISNSKDFLKDCLQATYNEK